MPIFWGDSLEHSNNKFSIADIENIRGGARKVSSFDNTTLSAQFSTIPDKIKIGHTFLIDTSTDNLYYLASGLGTDTSNWKLISGGGGPGATGPTGPTGATGETGPYPFYYEPSAPVGTGTPSITAGSFWYNTTDDSLYVYLHDTSGSPESYIWVLVDGGGGPGPTGPTGPTGPGSGGVLQYPTTGDFPSVGSTGHLYIDLSTNDSYYWRNDSSPSLYVLVDAFTSDQVVSISTGKTFGRYLNGDTIPAKGKSAKDVITLALREALSPTVGLTSPTIIPFNLTNINNILTTSYTINSLGATVQSAVLEWRRAGSPTWTTLSTSTANPNTVPHVMTDTAFNPLAFNYRYIVTDTAGGTNTATFNITPISYVPPSITLNVAATILQTDETNLNRERGNVSSIISGTISRVPTSQNLIGLLNYTVQFSNNGGATWNNILGQTNIPISGQSATISSFTHYDTGSVSSESIRYRVIVNDERQATTSSQVTVTFSNYIYYSPVSSAPTDSAAVRSITIKDLANTISGTFTLNTDTVEKVFAIAIPATMTITKIKDLDALGFEYLIQPGTFGTPEGVYILQTFDVNDFAGNPVSYKVYVLTNAQRFTDGNHRHQVTL